MIKIIAVGKLKEEYWAKSCLEYVKRLGVFCKLEIVEVLEGVGDSVEQVKAFEGKAILDKLKGFKGEVIALAPCGKELDSVEFAATLRQSIDTKGGIAFIIGGSHGLDQCVLRVADRVMSFGKMTYPHQLFRVMLLEQTYRGFMIGAGRVYHK